MNYICLFLFVDMKHKTGHTKHTPLYFFSMTFEINLWLWALITFSLSFLVQNDHFECIFFLLIIINISFFFVNLPLIIYSLKETKDYDDKENHWIEFVDMITDFFENHLKHSKLCLILVHIIFVLYFVFIQN